MAGHGGYRPGSGPKSKKSLSESALESLGAVVYGLGDSLVVAGRQILPGADDAEAMRAAVAGIGHDNILAGNGMRVVELFAAGLERLARVQPNGGGGTGSSLLDAAMRSLPGAGEAGQEGETGENWAQSGESGVEFLGFSEACGSNIGDDKSPARAVEAVLRSDSPIFAPQASLFPAYGPGAGGAKK